MRTKREGEVAQTYEKYNQDGQHLGRDKERGVWREIECFNQDPARLSVAPTELAEKYPILWLAGPIGMAFSFQGN
jgi:hypothetical protein